MSDDLLERLDRGVLHCGLHDDNETELFEVDDANDTMAEAKAEIEKLKSIVQGWHYLAVGPDEMGDYYTQKQLIKASEPYASPALKALGEMK